MYFVDERPLVVGSMSVNCSLANDSILIIITLHNPIPTDLLGFGTLLGKAWGTIALNMII